MIPRYSSENWPNIMKLADELKRVGQKHNATSGQVALAWLLAQGDDILPIPGTRKVKASVSHDGPCLPSIQTC